SVLALSLSLIGLLFCLSVELMFYGLSDVIFYISLATSSFLFAIISIIISMNYIETLAEQHIC
ncbi:ligase, partial [Erwinia amylovora]|uniref:hypothetical protein n=1 Tax=Erwinia amylovora TaxID=552 RepID=UPI00387E78C2|nr:ligase [Erwinia amylovora]